MRVAVSLALLALVFASARSIHAEPLQYAFEAGDAFTYSVRIEADEPTYKDVLQGNITLTAQAGVTDQAGGRFAHAGVLVPVQLGKDGTALTAPRPSRLTHLGFGLADEDVWGIDRSGEVLLPVAAKRSAPFALGSMQRLLIEPLGPPRVGGWDVSDDCILSVQPLPGSATIPTPLPAHEHIVYTLGTTANDKVPINTHYDLKADQLVGGEPRIRITGDGQTVFDTKLGMPRGSLFHGTLATRSAAGTDQTPLVVTVNLLKYSTGSAAPLIPPIAPAETGADVATEHPVAPAAIHAQVLTNEDRSAILADLRSADGSKRLDAANRLAGSAPDDHAPEISQALQGSLGDADLYVRQAAVRGLAVWGGPAVIPAIIKLLDDKDFSVRWAALDALGDMRSTAAAPAIAQKLTSGDQFKAGPALEQIGPPAAAAVVPYLKEKDWTTRLEACRILKEIGGPAQVPALESLARDENALVRTAAGEAVRTIRAR